RFVAQARHLGGRHYPNSTTACSVREVADSAQRARWSGNAIRIQHLFNRTHGVSTRPVRTHRRLRGPKPDEMQSRVSGRLRAVHLHSTELVAQAELLKMLEVTLKPRRPEYSVDLSERSVGFTHATRFDTRKHRPALKF